MSLASKLLAIPLLLCIFACIFFVLFGQITVRKLRKNEKTKDALGLEFTSGWDILNVAQALSLPKKLKKKMENSSLSFLNADSELLRAHTNKLDRLLAQIFFWLWVVSGSMLIILVILDAIGVLV